MQPLFTFFLFFLLYYSNEDNQCQDDLVCEIEVTTTPEKRSITFIGTCVDDTGCLVGGTLVIMADGSTKEIQDIKALDVLKGVDGSEQHVLLSYSKQLLSERLIGFNGGIPFATPDHPFLIPGNPNHIQVGDLGLALENWPSSYASSLTQAQVGNPIYQYNPSSGNFESVPITSVDEISAPRETLVYALITISASAMSYSGIIISHENNYLIFN